jgi:hypothetical protein
LKGFETYFSTQNAYNIRKFFGPDSKVVTCISKELVKGLDSSKYLYQLRKVFDEFNI